MNKKLKRLIKKHVDTVKSMYPEVYIEVEEDGDEIFVCIDSLDISNEVEYEALIIGFIREYHSKGFGAIYWGVNSTLTCDNLVILEDMDKALETENLKQRVINF